MKSGPIAALSIPYITSLDGIRGVAALAVVVAHYGYLSCGWITVQFFFVLSGFLITAILLDSREKYGGYPVAFFGIYFWRRVLRIFPLYFAFIGICAIFLHKTIPGAVWMSLLTYTYNFTFLWRRDPQYIFSHVWSLQVEEQFYIVWPFVVFFLSRRVLKWVVAGILIAIPLLRIALFLANGGLALPFPILAATYYVQTIFQLDAIASGAAIAVFGWIGSRVRQRWLFILLALAFAAGIVNNLIPHPDYRFGGTQIVMDGVSLGYPLWMGAHAQYLWGYSVVNLLSVVLILVAAQPNAVSRFFNRAPLRYTGTLSYGIYIIHDPVINLTHTWLHAQPWSLPGFLIFLPVLALTFLLAHLSYRYYEKRFLDLKDRVPAFIARRMPAPRQPALATSALAES